MPSIHQQGQFDGKLFGDAMREVSDSFEEQITILVYQSQSGGAPTAGVAATPSYTTVHARANVRDLAATETFFPASDYQTGDLQIELRYQVFGAIAVTGQDGQTKGRQSDLVVYRGRTYYFVGHIHRLQNLGGRVYWKGQMRPKGA